MSDKINEARQQFVNRLLPDDERDLIAAFKELTGGEFGLAMVSASKAKSMIDAHRKKHGIESLPN